MNKTRALLAVLTLATACTSQRPTVISPPEPQTAAETPPPQETPPAPTPTQPFAFEFGPFRYKSADIKDVRHALERHSDKLRKAFADLPPDGRVIVRGHADASGPEEPQGTKAGNIALSRRRAQAVADWLAKNTGLETSRIIIEASGSSRLKNPSKPKAAENRRVEVLYTP